MNCTSSGSFTLALAVKKCGDPVCQFLRSISFLGRGLFRHLWILVTKTKYAEGRSTNLQNILFPAYFRSDLVVRSCWLYSACKIHHIRSQDRSLLAMTTTNAWTLFFPQNCTCTCFDKEMGRGGRGKSHDKKNLLILEFSDRYKRVVCTFDTRVLESEESDCFTKLER